VGRHKMIALRERLLRGTHEAGQFGGRLCFPAKEHQESTDLQRFGFPCQDHGHRRTRFGLLQVAEHLRPFAERPHIRGEGVLARIRAIKHRDLPDLHPTARAGAGSKIPIVPETAFQPGASPTASPISKSTGARSSRVATALPRSAKRAYRCRLPGSVPFSTATAGVVAGIPARIKALAMRPAWPRPI